MPPRSASEATYARAQATLRTVLTRVVAAHPLGRTPELVVAGGQAIGAAAARHGYSSPQHQDLVEVAVDRLMLGELALELLTAMLSFAQAEVEAVRPAPIADALEPEARPESVEMVPARPSKMPTAPPPAGWNSDDEITRKEEDGYERKLTGDLARLLDPTPTGKTLPSWRPPAPAPRDRPTVRLKPPPIPDVLSKHLRDKDKGGRY